MLKTHHLRRGTGQFLFAALFLSLILFSACSGVNRGGLSAPIKVGVYPNKPLAFIDANGQVNGFYVDILNSIAQKEHWQIEYVPCSFANCLTALQNGDLNLVVAVAYSDERAQTYDYNQVTFLENWGQIYIRKGEDIRVLGDLQGKTVAVVTNDIYYAGLKSTLAELGISPQFIERDDYGPAMSAVNQSQADAALVSRLFGIENEYEYNLVRSPIVCCTRELRLAVQKGWHPDVVAKIDADLLDDIKNPRSIYHQAVQQWINGETAWIWPDWLSFTLAGLLSLLAVTSAIGFILRRQVQTRTADLVHANQNLQLEIDERKQIEDALRESEQRYSSIFENSLSVMLSVNPTTGAIVDANPAACAFYGYPSEQFKQLNWSDLGQSSSDSAVEFLDEAESSQINYLVTRHRLSDGQERQMEIYPSPITIQGQTLVHMILHDITQREQSQQDLIESKRALTTLMSNLPGIAYRCKNDPERTMEIISEGCLELTGYVPEDLIANHTCSFTSRVNSQDREVISIEIDAAVQEHRPYQLTYRIITARGIEKWVWEQGQGVYDYDGKPVALEGFITDITERIWAENVQSVLFNINQAAHSSRDLEDLLNLIQQELGRLMDATNFFVAMYDDKTRLYSFAYSVDEYDDFDLTPQELPHSLTDYVRRKGKPVFVDDEMSAELSATGEVEVVGVPSKLWLGAPLIAEGKTVGVVAIQSYEDPELYTPKDLETLTLVSDNIAQAIARKRSETEIVRLAAVLEQSSELVVIADINSDIVYVNPYFEKVSGYTVNDLLGKPLIELPKKMDGKVVASELHDALVRGEQWSGTVTAYRPNGTSYIEELAAFPVKDGNGKIINYALVSTDITAKQQRERELEAVVNVVAGLKTAEYRSEMIAIILEQLLGLLKADGAALAITAPDLQSMKVELGLGRWDQWTGEEISVENPILAQVVQSRKLYLNNEFPADSEMIRSDLLGDHRAILCAPLISNEQLIGALWAGSKSSFEEMDGRLLVTISDIVANSIDRATLYEQTQLRLQRLAALRAIDMAISSSLDLNLTLNVLLSQVTTQFKIDAAAVLLLNPYTHVLEYAAGRGFRTDAVSRSHLHLGEGYAGKAALQRSAVHVEDIQKIGPAFLRSDLLSGEGFISYYAIPLVAKGQVNGVLDVYHRSHFEGDAEWLDFLEAVALQAAIAVNNADLFDNLQKSHMELTYAYDETLEGWVRALDLRDKEAEGHTKRVTQMVLRIARVMGIDDADLGNVRRGALLHDIGKMGVPDQILRKTGALTEDETKVMRKHPEYAYQLLSPIRYLRPAMDIPYCHHERWDGTGYPRGLKGDQIPLSARIFSVVDVWDALCSDRPYRPAWRESDALDYIRAQAGIQFDPKVVQVFLNVRKQDYM